MPFLTPRFTKSESLLEETRRLLRQILANGPVAVALAIETVDVGLTNGEDAGLRFETTAFGLAASTEDLREGTTAFFERRPPVFTGR